MYSDMDDHTRLADKNGTESTGKGWGGDSAWDTQLQACVAAALPNSGAQVLTVVAYSFGRMATQPQAELLQVGTALHCLCMVTELRTLRVHTRLIYL